MLSSINIDYIRVTGVIYYAGSADLFRAREFTPGFWWCPLFILFSFLCCVVLCFILFVIVLCLMYPMLPVSLDCPFLIALSVFSNVYLFIALVDMWKMLDTNLGVMSNNTAGETKKHESNILLVCRVAVVIVWTYNYLCNKCLSPLTLWVGVPLMNGEVYPIQHYVINYVSDLRQVGGFLHQQNWPSRYNWNIVETGTAKLNATAPLQIVFASQDFYNYNVLTFWPWTSCSSLKDMLIILMSCCFTNYSWTWRHWTRHSYALYK